MHILGGEVAAPCGGCGLAHLQAHAQSHLVRVHLATHLRQVSVAGSAGNIYFLWAIAQPGYASDVLVSADPNRLVVVFYNGIDQSVLVATWVDEELVLDIVEGVL